MKDLDYIEFCCPCCGSKIFLCVNNDRDSEMFEEKYDCTNCGNNLNIQYDRVLAELNIKAGMYLMNK